MSRTGLRPGHMSSIVSGLTDAKMAPIVRQLVAEGKLPDPWEIRRERAMAAEAEKKRLEEVKLAQMTPDEREAYQAEKAGNIYAQLAQSIQYLR